VGCVESSIRGGGQFDEAWADCKAVGRRLMTANELLAVPDSSGVGNEWSGAMWEEGGEKMAMVVSSNGFYFGRPTLRVTSVFAYRCMQLP
jgi:hypothetical protein